MKARVFGGEELCGCGGRGGCKIEVTIWAGLDWGVVGCCVGARDDDLQFKKTPQESLEKGSLRTGDDFCGLMLPNGQEFYLSDFS